MTASKYLEETFASSVGAFSNNLSLGDLVSGGVSGGILEVSWGLTLDARDLSGGVYRNETFTDAEITADIVDAVGTTARPALGVRVSAAGLGYYLRPVVTHTHDGVWELIAYTDDSPETYVQLATFTPAAVSGATVTCTASLAVVGTLLLCKVYETADGDPGWGNNANCMFATDATISAAGYTMLATFGLATTGDKAKFDNAYVRQWDRVNGTSLGGTADTTALATYTHTTTQIIRANRPVLIAVENTKGTSPPNAPGTPTMTGLTVSALVKEQGYDTTTTPLKRMTIFAAMTATDIASGSVLSVAFGGVNQTGCIIHMLQFDGAHALDSDGSDAFPNSQSGGNNTASTATPAVTITYTNAYATSGVVMATGQDANAGQAADSPMNELDDNSHATPTSGLMTAWDDSNDTTPSATTSSARNAIIAAEVRRNDPRKHYGQFLFPTAIASTALYQPSVAVGAVSVLAQVIASTALYAPTVVQYVAVPALTSTALYQPSVSNAAGAQQIDLDLLAGTVLYQPSVLQTVAVPALSGTAIYEPSVTQTIAVPSLAGTALYDPAVIQVVAADALTSTALYQPAVSVGAVDVAAQTISSTAIYEPAATAGEVSVLVETLTSTVLFEPIISTGGSLIVAQTITGTVIYEPALTMTVAVPLLQAVAVFAPGVVQALDVPTIAGTELFAPSVRYVVAVEILISTAVHTPAVTTAVITIEVPVLVSGSLHAPRIGAVIADEFPVRVTYREQVHVTYADKVS